jgi:nuclear pore complex protein Nup160
MAMTTYQRYRALQWVSEQAADDTRNQKTRRSSKRSNGDDILSEGIVTLRVREGEEEGVDTDEYETAYSLPHSLLARGMAQGVSSGALGEISSATTSFMDATLSLYDGLWDNVPLEKDVRLALSILEDGQPVHTGVFTSSFPDSSGMMYIKARAYLDIGEIEHSVTHFERAARGCHGEYLSSLRRVILLTEDGSLQCIIPHSGTSSVTTDYYRHVVRLYRDRGVEEPIVRFGNLALQSTTPEDPAVKDIWTTVFLASVSLGLYEKAYVALTSTPYSEL